MSAKMFEPRVVWEEEAGCEELLGDQISLGSYWEDLGLAGHLDTACGDLEGLLLDSLQFLPVAVADGWAPNGNRILCVAPH